MPSVSGSVLWILVPIYGNELAESGQPDSHITQIYPYRHF